ncbi:hypothetical protein B566_EDAN001148 [Ephemera danica]|nr:hypothetical protein B566_EDAN001148 [Ephemera danica]
MYFFFCYRFERNKDRNIFVVNCGNKPHEFDQVNIFCPFYKNDTPRNAETYKIYSATKEEYDTCTVKTTRPSYPLVCNKPGGKIFYTVTFRQYSPQPHGLEFRPGEDHYFVSTEHENNTENIGGPCVRTSNATMRMVIRVCCRNESCKSSSTTERPQNLPGPINMAPTTRAPQVLSSSSTALPPLLPPLRPMPPKEVPEITSHGKSSNKKSSEYDKHPNEVVKNEELTYNSAPSSLRVRWWSPQFVLPAILVLVWR